MQKVGKPVFFGGFCFRKFRIYPDFKFPTDSENKNCTVWPPPPSALVGIPY